jgi:hypothetical protein
MGKEGVAWVASYSIGSSFFQEAYRASASMGRNRSEDLMASYSYSRKDYRSCSLSSGERTSWSQMEDYR